MARTSDPFSRAHPHSKAVGKDSPGPNRTPGGGRLRFARFLLVATLLATPALAREISGTALEPDFPAPLVSDADRFNLYTGCAQFSLSVSFAKSATRTPSKLTRKIITDSAVLRMSGAGLLGDSRYSMQIGVRAAGAAATLWLFFLKPLHDPLIGQTRQAVSGSRIVTGAGMRPPGHALAAVGHIVDEFLRKYQMVNREACEAG